MSIISRKEDSIETRFTKLNVWIVYALLFVTFVFASVYEIKSGFLSMPMYLNAFNASVTIDLTTSNFILFSVVYGVLLVVINEVILTAYYYFAFQSTRLYMPFSKNEFVANMRVFIVLRNVIWGVLGLTMFIPGGYFIGFGVVLYEILATMIMILLAFKFMKEHYIKPGYSARLLMAFMVPYLVINGVSIVSGFVGGIL